MNYSQIIELYRDAVGFIALPLNKDGKNVINIRGSGFVAGSNGEILTCAHIYNEIPDKERINLFIGLPDLKDNKITRYSSHQLSLITKDDENDIALFRTEKIVPFIKPIPLGNDKAVLDGDDVGFLGFPLANELVNMGWGITLSANRCIIGAVKRRANDHTLHFFQLDTYIRPGNSGSPLFSLEEGKVIGITAGYINQEIKELKGVKIPQMIGLARPISYGKKLLTKAIK